MIDFWHEGSSDITATRIVIVAVIVLASASNTYCGHARVPVMAETSASQSYPAWAVQLGGFVMPPHRDLPSIGVGPKSDQGQASSRRALQSTNIGKASEGSRTYIET